MHSTNNSRWDFDVAVIGLGYVGLPLLLESIRSGLSAIGFDQDENKINKLLNGDFEIESHFEDFADSWKSSGLPVTQNESEISNARVVVICVPTPVDQNLKPDLSAVINAAQTVGRHLSKGQLVVLESTVAPGTTRNVVKQIIEQTSKKIAGEDFHLAFSPERIDPSNSTFFLHNTPKIVGGYSEACSEKAMGFYTKIVNSVVLAKGLEEAEAAKLLENIYRHVNIALINEFAISCSNLGIDVYDVISAASTKPFGFSAFWPSIGAGGHCIPVDPNYFNEAVKDKTGKDFEFIKLANEINSYIPDYFSELTFKLVEEKQKSTHKATSKILVMGLTYKPNVGDFRESPSIDLCKKLLGTEVQLYLHDPHLIPTKYHNLGIVISDEDLEKYLAEVDFVLVLQGHSQYRSIADKLRVYKEKIISPVSPEIIPSGHGYAKK